MDCPVSTFPHVTTLQASKTVQFPEPIHGNVTGSIPSWLNGNWYRNGPGVVHFRDESVNHWFDGMALTRKFEIKDGNATYMSRLVESESLEKNMAAGKIAVAEFGSTIQPETGLLKRFKSLVTMPEFTDNCLINIMKLGDHLFAITESNFIREIDPKSLDTKDKVDLSKYLPINIMASHPLVDADGSVYTFSSSIFNKGRTKYNLLKFPKAAPGTPLKEILANSEAVCSLDSSWRVSPSYHHSFAMSENYAIFVEMPLKIDIPKMAVAHMRHMCYNECIERLPNTQTRIYLVNKKTGKPYPTIFKTDPLIVYHHINAYEDGNNVVLDLCCYQSNSFYDKFKMENLEMSPADFIKKFDSDDMVVKATRIIMPLIEDVNTCASSNLVTVTETTCTAEVDDSGTIMCHPEILSVGKECPVINNRHLGHNYRFFYSAGGHVLPPGEKLVKVDTKKEMQDLFWTERGCWASQPVFVPNPLDNNEDDGVLLSSVTSETSNPFLLILDAKDFKELARVHFDANIPPDVHGLFVPRDQN